MVWCGGVTPAPVLLAKACPHPVTCSVATPIRRFSFVVQIACTPPHRQRAKLQVGVALEPILGNQPLHILIRRQPLPTECRQEALPAVAASRATQCAIIITHVRRAVHLDAR
eukprot:scaffold25389_cov28-Phaeocystis_antarctica.AAC.2